MTQPDGHAGAVGYPLALPVGPHADTALTARCRIGQQGTCVLQHHMDTFRARIPDAAVCVAVEGGPAGNVGLAEHHDTFELQACRDVGNACVVAE